MQLLGFTFGALYWKPRSWRAMTNQSILVVYVKVCLAVFKCFPAYYGGPAVTFFPRLAVVTCFLAFYCGPAVTFFPRLVATTCVFPRLAALHFSNAWMQIDLFPWLVQAWQLRVSLRLARLLLRRRRKIGNHEYLVTATSLFFSSSMSSCTWAIFASYCWFVKPFSSSTSSTFFLRSRCLDRSSSNCFDVNRSSFSNARTLSLFSSNPALYCCT